MKEFWRSTSILLATLVIYLLNFNFCWSLNNEGMALLRFKEKVTSDSHGALSNWVDEIGIESPCNWFGIECFEGYVVALNLKDLLLRGTLAPDIGDLIHVKSIILRNNSFSGFIPQKLVNLKELEILDLGYNNFSGQISCQLDNNCSTTIFLLDNNELFGDRNSEIYKLHKLSDAQVVEDMLSSTKRSSDETRNTASRKLLHKPTFFSSINFLVFSEPPDPIRVNSPPPASSPSPLLSSSTPTPTPTPGPALAPDRAPVLAPARAPVIASPPSPPSVVTPPISPSPLLTQPSEGPHAPTQHFRSNRHRNLVVTAATGGSVLLLLVIAIFFWQSGKVSTVKPWATGLSGQLQRAFVTGVPKLKRSELVSACEDFSNVIGTSSLCTLYKGTLSSGVEIAVASIAVASTKDWSNSLENQFRKKIDTLSKMNHKNFVNLLGYCVGEEPFTRMMVFEYAPNGTFFEHLHIKESEHLDWPMRLRIAMGIAYCLDHMHQSTPALAHRNLNSSIVYLTDDYAAKISDFAFSDEEGSSAGIQPIAQNNIYGFGVILFEMITGRLPYSSGSDPVDDWASEYLSRGQNLQGMVDPTLETYREDQLHQIGGVIKLCANPDPRFRPSMYEVCVRMREITGIEPDGALPKVSPLWWAELEILSTEAS